MLIIQDFFFCATSNCKNVFTNFCEYKIYFGTNFTNVISWTNIIFFLGLKTYKQNIKLAAYVPSLNVEMSTGTYSAEAATDSSCFK